MECPNCRLINPDTTIRCDCEHDFRSGRPQPLPPDGAATAPTGRAVGGRTEARKGSRATGPRRPSSRRDRAVPLGWISIVCACLPILSVILVALILAAEAVCERLGFELPTEALSALGLPLLRMLPLLWIGAVVLGIVAIGHGDRARGIAALTIYGAECFGAVIGAGIAAGVGYARFGDYPSQNLGDFAGLALAPLALLFWAVIGALAGGLVAAVISLCVLVWTRRRAAKRQRRPVARNGRRPGNAIQSELEQHRED